LFREAGLLTKLQSRRIELSKPFFRLEKSSKVAKSTGWHVSVVHSILIAEAQLIG
jgi:hypothetical protein